LEIRKTIANHFKDIKLDMENNNTPRPKRGIQFLGDFLNFCCNAITKKEVYPLYENENKIRENYDNIRETLLEEHADLLTITTQLNQFSADTYDTIGNITDILKAVGTQLDKGLMKEAETDIHLKMIAQLLAELTNSLYFNDIYTHCTDHRLPISLVPVKDLRKNLIALNVKLSKKQLTLSIPVENILQYYVKEITHCQISDTKIFIELRVPVKKLNSKWKLFQYIPIFFKHMNQLCILNTDEMLIAYDKNNDIFQTIAGTSMKNCDITTGLCYIEYFDYSNEAPECAKYLFLSKSYEELNEVCHFKCEPSHQRTVVRKLNSNDYLLSNLQPILIFKNTTDNTNKQFDINYNLPGALSIHLPCEIALYQTTKNVDLLLIPEKFPCLKNEIEDINIERIIPLQWTTMDSASLDFSTTNTMKFSNMTKIFDTNWKSKTPHFEIKSSQKTLETRLSKLELKQPPQSFFSSDFLGDIIYITWLLLLTMIDILILYIGFTLRDTNIKNKIKIETLENNPPKENIEMRSRSSFRSVNGSKYRRMSN